MDAFVILCLFFFLFHQASGLKVKLTAAESTVEKLTSRVEGAERLADSRKECVEEKEKASVCVCV